MANQEILEKALQKAIDGGFGMNAWKNWEKAWLQTDDYGYEIRISKGKNEKSIGWFPSEYDIIFNHDFAKALWGEEELSDLCLCGQPRDTHPMMTLVKHGNAYNNRGWKYHLQRMVIDPNPIEYLGRHLND